MPLVISFIFQIAESVAQALPLERTTRRIFYIGHAHDFTRSMIAIRIVAILRRCLDGDEVNDDRDCGEWVEHGHC